MARIVIGSFVVRFPLGDYLSWTLQWLLGFKRLGHDVYLLEKSGYDNACFDPATRTSGNDCSYGTGAGAWLLEHHGLSERWCFVDAAGGYRGMSRQQVAAALAGADVFVDMGSHGAWLEEAAACRMRAYVDGAPGFRQMHWQQRSERGERVPAYDRYYAVGTNIGTALSSARTPGVEWHHEWDPVLVDLYGSAPPPPGAPLTTVMSWQAHEPVEFEGRVYGEKGVEFARIIVLPGRSAVAPEIAVGGSAPIEKPRRCGWRVRDSIDVTASFDSWQRSIAASPGGSSACARTRSSPPTAASSAIAAPSIWRAVGRS